MPPPMRGTQRGGRPLAHAKQHGPTWPGGRGGEREGFTPRANPGAAQPGRLCRPLGRDTPHAEATRYADEGAPPRCLRDGTPARPDAGTASRTVPTHGGQTLTHLGTATQPPINARILSGVGGIYRQARPAERRQSGRPVRCGEGVPCAIVLRLSGRRTRGRRDSTPRVHESPPHAVASIRA